MIWQPTIMPLCCQPREDPKQPAKLMNSAGKRRSKHLSRKSQIKPLGGNATQSSGVE